MGIRWKNRVKKIITEALLGVLLIIPLFATSTETLQAGILQTEVDQEQGRLFYGSLLGGSLAEGELSGGEGKDETEIMPCGDWVEEKKEADN